MTSAALGAVEREQHGAGRLAHELAPHRGQRLGGAVEAVDVGGAAPLATPFGRERASRSASCSGVSVPMTATRGARRPRAHAPRDQDARRSRSPAQTCRGGGTDGVPSSSWLSATVYGRSSRDLRDDLEVVAHQRTDDHLRAGARARPRTAEQHAVFAVRDDDAVAVAGGAGCGQEAGTDGLGGSRIGRRVEREDQRYRRAGPRRGVAGAGIGAAGPQRSPRATLPTGVARSAGIRFGGAGAGCAGAGAAMMRAAPARRQNAPRAHAGARPTATASAARRPRGDGPATRAAADG